MNNHQDNWRLMRVSVCVRARVSQTRMAVYIIYVFHVSKTSELSEEVSKVRAGVDSLTCACAQGRSKFKL